MRTHARNLTLSKKYEYSDTSKEGGTNMEKMMKLNFRVDGEVYQSVSVEKGEAVMAIDPPQKEGHRFVRWEGLPDKGVPGKEYTVDAIYEVESYTITFKVDGVEVGKCTLPYGAKVELPDVSTLIGDKVFKGWTNPVDVMPAGDLVVEGVTEPATFRFTMLVDDEVFATYDFPAGADLSDLPTPEREGHDFSGWNKNYKKMPHSNITIKGRFKAHIHTLTFEIEDEMKFSKSLPFGAPIRALGMPVREGYTFTGWGYVPATMPDEDLYFKGRFEMNAHVLKFILEGKLIYQSTIPFGTPIKPLEVETKEGYMFSGWRGLPKTMPDADFTVEGKYYVRKYKAVYMVDGVEYRKQTVAYGAALELEAPPEQEGRTFSGWQNAPDTMPAEDIVIVGQFE